MNLNQIYKKALLFEFLSIEEGLFLYENAPTAELMAVAHELRKKIVPQQKVTWQIDRNVNITNVCISGCKFCNFHCKLNDPKTYITNIDQYCEKIEELFQYGGNQLLLQGGLHPHLGLLFYTDLFQELKKRYPTLKLHALGPPEIFHIARLEKKTYQEILTILVESGLDSLPGAGAEILSDRVRKLISPGKCNSQQWLDVMKQAHQLNITTSATMMYGHIETNLERIEHLVKLRNIQSEKPEKAKGFLAFIAWPFQNKNTELKVSVISTKADSEEYIRTIAISRIMLPNIQHIQASWLTVGKDIAQICLYAGADDLGSIMIEENVVSAAGATYQLDSLTMQQTIVDAGFEPQLRNQQYEIILQ